MTIKEIYALPVDHLGWRRLPTGNYVEAGRRREAGRRLTPEQVIEYRTWLDVAIEWQKNMKAAA